MSTIDLGDFVTVDAHGNTIDPTAEASFAVADEFGDELFVHDGTDEWYLEGMRECEELRARLDAFVLPEDSSSSDDDDDGPLAASASNVISTDEAAMGEPTFSREFSDNAGDEWELDWVIRRRTTKAVQREYDEDGNLQTRTAVEYLCQWKWYREPTWESRSALEDLGLVARLDAFDAARAAKSRTAKRRPHRIKPQTYSTGALEGLMGDGFADRVLKKLRSEGMHVCEYAPVEHDGIERRFIKRWKESPDTFCPMILFHGTRKQNINSIMSTGLKVPGGGSGVEVVNGSAYGVGIYAAKDASFSLGYTNCDLMFVCLGLVGPQYTTMKDCGNICVFFDEELIVPLWLIRFDHSSGNEPPTRKSALQLNGFFGFPLAASASPPLRSSQPPMTKKMIKQMPRNIKELYKRGELRARKSS